MAGDGLRIGGLSSGLAVILNGEDRRESSQKTHIVSYYDNISHQSVERTLEHIFDLPYRSFHPLTCSIDTSLVRAILKNDTVKFRANQDVILSNRDGVCITDNSCGPDTVAIDEASICGEIRILKQRLLVESLAMFSSARANVCVWKGKWMYEVILETSGIQQLGWATLSCPFIDHKGVGDAEDSYAFDGRRVSKWNKEAKTYGQSWVVGDVIGCCIDLDQDEILFYRNGVSLGVAFDGVRKMGPGLGYYPAISLSQGERCELNFGGCPFKYPIEGFLPLQAPPSLNSLCTHLLQCLSRLLEMQSMEKVESTSVEKLGILKRFVHLEELFYPIFRGICEEFFSAIDAEPGSAEYVGWGPLISFLMEVFRTQAPHDYASLDRIVDLFLEFQGSRLMFEHVINALSCVCRTASLILAECPYSGSYSYIALACHLLRREELMVLWWKSPDFEFLLEGFLSFKGPNKQDLQCLMPSVWWPGSSDLDMSCGSSMMLITTALSEAFSKMWSYEYLDPFRPQLRVPSEDSFPRSARWSTPSDKVDGHLFEKTREELDRLSIDRVTLRPYACLRPSVRALGGGVVRFISRRVAFSFQGNVEFYLGERVQHQLDGEFRVPLSPLVDMTPSWGRDAMMEHWYTRGFPISSFMGEVVDYPDYWSWLQRHSIGPIMRPFSVRPGATAVGGMMVEEYYQMEPLVAVLEGNVQGLTGEIAHLRLHCATLEGPAVTLRAVPPFQCRALPERNPYFDVDPAQDLDEGEDDF